MAGQLELDGKVFNLKLGKSFDNDGEVAYHSIRYDFKPASIDVSKDATLEIDEGNSVTVTVPHVEGALNSHTVFRGNKKPSQKECVLIINHDANEVVLEKLSSFMQVKSTRHYMKGSSGGIKRKQDSPGQSTSVVAPSQPDKSKAAAAAPAKSEPPADAKPKSEPAAAADTKPGHDRMCENLSASSSSAGDMSEDSGDDRPVEDVLDQVPVSSNKTAKTSYHSVLSHDLQLSESDSD